MNFVLRFLSSVLLAPLFIFFLYNKDILIYILVISIISIGSYELFHNVKQKILCLFLIFFLFLFGYLLIKLRGSNLESFIETCWLLSIVWLSDIGGYIFGKLIGGKKLSKFSPNKTFSGFFGSIFLSQFAFLFPYILIEDLTLNVLIFFVQFLICITAVVGDIFFSYVKRINYIKDYSNIIPGHGGVLDRIDGMIFAVIFYFFIKILI